LVQFSSSQEFLEVSDTDFSSAQLRGRFSSSDSFAAMALQHAILALFVALVVVPLAQADFQLECKMLPVEECAFAVSYSGHRCVLEKTLGSDQHVCEISNVKAGDEAPVEYIESNECVEACGVDRMTIGFSTDELTSNSFIRKLCSRACRNTCVNLIDIYSNIIAGEGLTLSEFCGEQRRAQLIASRRLIGVAEAPV
jgi:hypothetical protein